MPGMPDGQSTSPSITSRPTSPPITSTPTSPPITSTPTSPPITSTPPPITSTPTSPPISSRPTSPPITSTPTSPPTTSKSISPPITSTTSPITSTPTSLPITSRPNSTSITSRPSTPTSPPITSTTPTITTPSGMEGELRLAEGYSSCSGRVEIFYQGQWGIVCDDTWDLSQAQVVCRQLGCGPALSTLTSNRFTLGSGPIWLDEVRCSGSESFLANCSHLPFGSHNCDYGDSAGVLCEENGLDYLLLSGRGPTTRASMSLFRDANYTAPYSAGPVNLPLGSILHVGVSVEEMDAEVFVVILEDCYATHSPDPDDLLKYFLIQHKCPTDRHQVTVEESGLSLKARFSALLFLFQGDYRDVYLHCSLHLCDHRNISCSPVCSGRSARTLKEPFKTVTIGPITWAQSLD